ncbi:MAG: hypothetical protein KAR42_17360 [candidate division Zixibacteria bacterium]|nr:hypothetical protein [candidate division Zixibacteria bacterium]
MAMSETTTTDEEVEGILGQQERTPVRLSPIDVRILKEEEFRIRLRDTDPWSKEIFLRKDVEKEYEILIPGELVHIDFSEKTAYYCVAVGCGDDHKEITEYNIPTGDDAGGITGHFSKRDAGYALRIVVRHCSMNPI